MQPRAENFADWYFAYSTSFKLLSEASLSLARHAAKLLEKTPINEAVAADMDRSDIREIIHIMCHLDVM